jgi:hypothetical protein
LTNGVKGSPGGAGCWRSSNTGAPSFSRRAQIGFKPEIDAQRWLIAKVTHGVTGTDGFTTALELECQLWGLFFPNHVHSGTGKREEWARCSTRRHLTLDAGSSTMLSEPRIELHQCTGTTLGTRRIQEGLDMAMQGIDPSSISLASNGSILHADPYASTLADSAGVVIQAGGANDMCTNQSTCKGTNIDCTNSGNCGGSTNMGACRMPGRQ